MADPYPYEYRTTWPTMDFNPRRLEPEPNGGRYHVVDESAKAKRDRFSKEHNKRLMEARKRGGKMKF